MLKQLGGAKRLFTAVSVVCSLVSSMNIWVSSSMAQGEFPEGAKNLFIGHSYFNRVAEQFEDIANDGDFPNHRFQEVSAPGKNGSPQALYENQETRDAIETILEQQDIELFWMTVHQKQDDGTYYYEEWINFALAQNPNTKIVIGFPRVTGGPSMGLEAFQDANDDQNQHTFDTIIVPLREKYSGQTDIFYIDYSEVMDRLWEKFDEGSAEALIYFNAQTECIAQAEAAGEENPREDCQNFDDLYELAEESLFRDTGGHAGRMGTHKAAMVWLYFLYENDDFVRFIDPSFGTWDVYEVGRDTVRQNFENFQPDRW